MLKRTLGKSNLEVSALGMGCWAIGGPWTWDQPGQAPFPVGWGNTNDGESLRGLQTALDLGVNFFDTAANYGAGHSEVLLGRAFKGKRHNVVIATKFGHIVNQQKKTVYSAHDLIIKNVRSDVENSLRRLQTDYIDIYQLHEGGYDPELDIAEVVVGLAGGYPYYVRKIAHELFHISSSPALAQAEEAVRSVLRHQSPVYSVLWESIKSPLHRKYLLAAANEPRVAHGDGFVLRHGLRSRSHVQRTEKQLEMKGIISDGEIIDPRLVLWLRSIAHQ